MNEQQFQTSLKRPTGNGLEEFMLLNGRYSNFTKETFFIRYICKHGYDKAINKLRTWQADNKTNNASFVFIEAIKSQPPINEVSKYTALYHDGNIQYPFSFENRLWQEAFEQGFQSILQLFKITRGRSEDAIIKNFVIKILYWIDLYFPLLFTDTRKMNHFPKFACSGTIKLSEYLFLYLLFLLGCDILYITADNDIASSAAPLLELSLRIEEKNNQAQPTPANNRAVISMDRIRRPERHNPPPKEQPTALPTSPNRNTTTPHEQLLDFEDLATFAASVAMIQVFDEDKQCFKTGSGVIINEKGYILTNFHVVSGGAYYGILLEEETDIFYTNELIKYHPDYDLAVLRMEKYRKPIPISNGAKELVRGQKVVAIGSPLGLFNSVSDGIISGFRSLENTSMIQFTAPVSHGSSGGALLDMSGNLIGLITAGYDDGQNLNLAVDYKTITQFIRGLL